MKNLPIIQKSLIAPGIACLMIAVIAGVFFTSSFQNTAKLEEAAQAEALVAQVKDLQIAVSTGHAILFRTLSWQQAGVSEEDVGKAAADGTAMYDRVSGLIEEVQAVMPADLLETATAIREKFDPYRAAAAETLDTIAIDAFLASMLMTDAHFQFQALSSDVDALAATLREKAETALEEAQTTQENARLQLGAVSAIALIAALTCGVLMGRAVTTPVRRITKTIGDLANGNIETEVTDTDRKDEVGEIAQALGVMKEGLVERAEMLEQRRAEEATRAERAKHIEKSIASFENLIGSSMHGMSTMANDLNQTASDMMSAAEDTNSQSDQVTRSADNASQNVGTVAAATEELAASINEITSKVSDASGLSTTAVEEAQVTNDRMQGLRDAAEKIGAIVVLIKDIAEQTNLLALNATIEAARAGESGKGFAVVANEVKSLATQSAKATEEISSQVLEIQQSSQGAADAIERVTDMISRVSEAATMIAGAVEEQSAATSEISRNVQDAASGTNEVSRSIVHVNEATAKTSDAASDVSGTATKMNSEIQSLRTQIDAFLKDVRAA